MRGFLADEANAYLSAALIDPQLEAMKSNADYLSHNWGDLHRKYQAARQPFMKPDGKAAAALFSPLVSTLPLDTNFLLHSPLREKLLTLDLDALHAEAQASGICLAELLLSRGLISDTEYLLALGKWLEIEAIFDKSQLHQRLPPDFDYHACFRYGFASFRAQQPHKYLILSEPKRISFLNQLTEAQRKNCLLVSAETLRDMYFSYRPKFIADMASYKMDDQISARSGLNIMQKLCLFSLLFFTLVMLFYNPKAFLLWVPLLLSPIFLFSSILTIATCLVHRPHKARFSPLLPNQLPRYSILVPLFKETRVLSDLLEALLKLDYPQEKLEIFLLVEECDTGMRKALAAIELPTHFRVLTVPKGAPQTKPRALNAALPFTTGKYLTIFDAEDRPEPQQLQKAVACFARHENDRNEVVCLQAKLIIDNAADHWISRLFALDYTALFSFLKAGQADFALPVPLGGTSNHFRNDFLKCLDGWDAWNVTEDADLGLRIACTGKRIADLDSFTAEEAPNSIHAFLYQRSRWLKGWMQTFITYTRTPLRSARAMGYFNYAAIISTMMSMILGSLLMPCFLALTLTRLMSEQALGAGAYIEPLADTMLITLGSFGILALILPLFCAHRQQRSDFLSSYDAAQKPKAFIYYLLFLPLWHGLIAIAATLAFHQLIFKPWHWNKTAHGLAKRRATIKVQKAPAPLLRKPQLIRTRNSTKH